MNDAAIERILHRTLRRRDGAATPAGEGAWDLSFPGDPDDPSSRTIAFCCRIITEDGRVSEIRADGDGGDDAEAIAEIQGELASAFARETITFPSFEDLTEYLAAETGAVVEDGTVEIAPAEGDDDSESVFAAVVPVAGEPWLSLSTPFEDEVDPDWLLEQNSDLTHVHFESFEGAVSLACAFPLALTTAQRLVELIDDLADERIRLLDALEEGDDEGDDEG